MSQAPALRPTGRLSLNYTVPAGPTKVVEVIRSPRSTKTPQLLLKVSEVDPGDPNSAFEISITHKKLQLLTVGAGYKVGPHHPPHTAPCLHTILSHASLQGLIWT